MIIAQRPLGNKMARGHCPSCGGHLFDSRGLNGEIRSKCQACGAEVSATQTVPSHGPPKATKGVILRDMSGTNKSKKQPANAVKPPGGRPADAPATVGLIKQAMQEKKVFSFSYLDASGNATFRTVEPYKLEVKNGKLVLFGYDVEKDAIRAFNLGGVSGCQLQDYNFKPKWPVEDLAP